MKKLALLVYNIKVEKYIRTKRRYNMSRANRPSQQRGGTYKLKKQKKRNGPVMKLIIGMASAAALSYCAYSIITDRADIVQKQAVLDGLYQEAEELRAENTSYESIINEDDERAYMERIAIDVLGYAYPSERRFYDTTRS